MPYGVIVLPDKHFSSQVVAYVTSLTREQRLLFRVGDDAPPHVTIAHLECDEETAITWWNEAAAPRHDLVDLRLSGLMFAPIAIGSYYAPEGGKYFGFEVVRTDELERLQRQVLEALPAGSTALTSGGHDYLPHMTLGIFTDAPTLAIELPESIVNATTSGALALGELGAYGTFPRIIKCTHPGYAQISA